MRLHHLTWTTLLAVASTLAGCGDDDDDGSEAQRRDVGAACAVDEDCTEEGQSCLDFKGGYCGVADCESDVHCPSGSACVAHEDGRNYCFLLCSDKQQCNQDRPVADEANCSSNITFAGGSKTDKACVPPSG